MQANKGSSIRTGTAGFFSALAVAALTLLVGRSIHRRLAPGQQRRSPLYDGTRNADASPITVQSGVSTLLRHEAGRPGSASLVGTRVSDLPHTGPEMESDLREYQPADWVPDQETGNGHSETGSLQGSSVATLVASDTHPSTPDEPVDFLATPRAEVKPGRNLRPLLVEIVQTVLLTLIIFAGVRSVVQNFKVDGASMEPTLHTGQYLLINKVAYTKLDGVFLNVAQQLGIAPPNTGDYYPFGGPQRGDIAVFQYPGGPERDFIKRVIAVPGDTVQIERGRVTVNGVLLDENYIRAVPSYSAPPQVVPAGQYYVLGDNRPNSSDSHIWGFVPADNMIGKAWVSYWPPSDWGAVSYQGIAAD